MNPNEIFTYPVESKSAKAKNAVQNYYCRFLDRKCDKQSRTIKYPMGVCSVNHSGTKPIICPHRFLENNLVFKNACNAAFGDTNNVLLFFQKLRFPMWGVLILFWLSINLSATRLRTFALLSFNPIQHPALVSWLRHWKIL